MAGVGRFALCPVVEGALVRFLVTIGENVSVATQVLHAVHAVSGCEFWTDELSYADADLQHVHGHRQVTDAYLVSPAESRGGVLATLDEGLTQEWPQTTLLQVHLSCSWLRGAGAGS